MKDILDDTVELKRLLYKECGDLQMENIDPNDSPPKIEDSNQKLKNSQSP